MQLELTVAPKTQRRLLQTPSSIGLLSEHLKKFWDTSSTSGDLQTDLRAWGPHQNSLPLFVLAPCLG